MCDSVCVYVCARNMWAHLYLNVQLFCPADGRFRCFHCRIHRPGPQFLPLFCPFYCIRLRVWVCVSYFRQTAPFNCYIVIFYYIYFFLVFRKWNNMVFGSSKLFLLLLFHKKEFIRIREFKFIFFLFPFRFYGLYHFVSLVYVCIYSNIASLTIWLVK